MITEQERNRRKEVIDFSRGNVRFEGVILSKEVEAINDNFINGDIDIEEHTDLCIAQMRNEFEIRKNLDN